MLRLMLKDETWSKFLPILGQIGINFKPQLRLTFEGILWKLRTGAPWRDLPDQFGPWSSVYNRFNEWSKAGKWQALFFAVRSELDDEWNFIDGTIISAHQHSTGAIGKKEEAIGKSRGGNTSKVHMLCDGHGNPIEFELTGGQVHDVNMANTLIGRCEADTLIADKAYDSEAVRKEASEKNIETVIPRRKGSKTYYNHDRHLYRLRHLIENLFARLKHFRSIATRYEKLKRNFEAIVYLGCIIHWLKL